jgi:hypothetical protein
VDEKLSIWTEYSSVASSENGHIRDHYEDRNSSEYGRFQSWQFQ